MAYENRPGSGALFPNRKQTDKHPDMRGDLKCPGCEQPFEVAAWEMRGNKGTFLSLKVSPPREQAAPPRSDGDDSW